MPTDSDTFLWRCTEQFRVQVEPSFLFWFHFLDGDTVSVGPCVVTDARDLPGHLDVWFVGLDAELTVGNFTGHNGLRELADDSELVAEITIQDLEPFGESHHGVALCDRKPASLSCQGRARPLWRSERTRRPWTIDRITFMHASFPNSNISLSN